MNEPSVPLDLQSLEELILSVPAKVLLSELRVARSALQRIVEEAKPIYPLHIQISQVPTSAIEAASKVLERVKD